MSVQVCFADGRVAWEVLSHVKVCDESGELGVVEKGKEIDFDVKRIFYLRGISEEATRGAHAHKELKQLIMCVNGSFSLHLDNGILKQTIDMKADRNCIFLDGRVWREMSNFSENAVMLVLCDREYRFDQVVRDYDQFIKNL